MPVDHDRWRRFARELLKDAPRRPVEPGGAIWEAEMARRGGRPYMGGAVCWNPAVSCDGVCRDCPRTWEDS